MRRVLLVALAALLFPLAAVAQQAILQGGPWTPAHVPVYAPGGGYSQPIVQDSGPAGGAGTNLGLSELLLTQRSPTNQYPSLGTGTGPFGTNICDYDAPITNPTGYHFLCFSPNTGSGGLIAYGSGGGATPLPLTLSINGQVITFPDGVFVPSFADNLTAAGTNQATALAVFLRINAVTTVAAGTGVILPTVYASGSPITAGYGVEIINAGANPVNVYPPVGQSINGGSTNAPVTVFMNGSSQFTYRGTGAWYAR